jgi:hypothetical protein
MADELVSLPVNVLATFGTPAARVAKGASVKVSPPLPVVFSFGSDPVAEGERFWIERSFHFLSARACARYGVLVVGEEMKGLVNCNFLPGSARRLELGTVSTEPLSRAY